MRYIALLRGINVGGNTMIKMAELKAMFESLGFKNVATYINSGNIAFDISPRSKASKMEEPEREALLTEQIEAAIEKTFGKPVPVMVRKQPAIEKIFAANPFDAEFESHKEMHVLFLKEKMPQDKQDQLMAASPEGERFSVKDREIYCHLKLGVADSLLGKGFIDKKLKVSFTARNWRTIEKLISL